MLSIFSLYFCTDPWNIQKCFTKGGIPPFGRTLRFMGKLKNASFYDHFTLTDPTHSVNFFRINFYYIKSKTQHIGSFKYYLKYMLVLKLG